MKRTRIRRVHRDANNALIDPQAITRLHYTEKKKQSAKKSILVWVNTYNRPEELSRLLLDIYKSKSKHQIKVLVIDDCSTVDYVELLDSFDGRLNIEYQKMEKNHGKYEYWKLCTYAMNEIAKSPHFDYCVKLDDDGRLVDRFFDRCINIWESIKDAKKICLNFRLDSREGQKVWTGVLPKKEIHNNIKVYRSQWVDMDFFVTMKFFMALNWRISKPTYARWHNPYASSGTGRDISTRLAKYGYNLYLTTQSLVQHDDHDSHMNLSERARHPLITKPFTDPRYGIL